MPRPESETRLAPGSSDTQARDLRTQECRHAHRQIEQAPFCWQHKLALRLIRDSCDAEKAVSSTLAVYVALTEIASDEESETFTTTHAWIALKSGLSARTVQDRLNRLSEIGLLEVSTPALKSPSKYRLLSVRQPLQNDKQPSQSVRQSPEQNPLPSSEENNEQRKEELPETSRADSFDQETEFALAFDSYLGSRITAGLDISQKLQNRELKMLKKLPVSQAIAVLKYTVNSNRFSVSAVIAKIRKTQDQK
jgi:hypothetical protein